MTQQSATHRSEDPEQRLVRFVSDASHEIVGPVNQVSSLVALFVNRYRGRLDSEADNLLEFIGSAGSRLANSANALRLYFQVLGRQPQPMRVETHETLSLVLRKLQREIDDCGAEFIFGTLPDIQGDATLLSLLFEAVIQNSLKFRRPDSPPKVVIAAERSSPCCRFFVSDNGIGVDPQFAEAVFTPFTKLNGHSYPGAGIGLTMARSAAELMGGRIWITTPNETGTTVFFDLPNPL